MYHMTNGIISGWSYFLFIKVIALWVIPWDNHGRTDDGEYDALYV
ncbi:hypothetical protein JCM14036_25990 [Desulfotomaculum defluvii]